MEDPSTPLIDLWALDTRVAHALQDNGVNTLGELHRKLARRDRAWKMPKIADMRAAHIIEFLRKHPIPGSGLPAFASIDS